jgi:hypothetical protein
VARGKHGHRAAVLMMPVQHGRLVLEHTVSGNDYDLIDANGLGFSVLAIERTARTYILARVTTTLAPIGIRNGAVQAFLFRLI